MNIVLLISLILCYHTAQSASPMLSLELKPLTMDTVIADQLSQKKQACTVLQTDMIHILLEKALLESLLSPQQASATKPVFTLIPAKIAPAVQAPIARQPKQLSLDEAVDLALKYKPDLEALYHTTKANESGAQAILAGYYPNINVTSVFSMANGQRFPVNTTYLAVDQLIYSFSGPLQAYRKAKKEAAISELEETIKANAIQLCVQTAFLKAFLSQEKAQVMRSSTRSTKAMLQQASAENNQRLLDKDAWLAQTKTYATDISVIKQADIEFQTACRQLELLTGQTCNAHAMAKDYKPLAWESKKNMRLYALETYYDYALANRPEIKQAAKRAEVEYENMCIARGKRLPAIKAGAQVGYAGQVEMVALDEQIIPKNTTFFNINVTLSWNIFDGLISHYEERQAGANRVKEILNKQQAVLDIKQEVLEKYAAVSQALTSLKTQRTSYRYARNACALAKQQYALGATTQAALKTAQTTWQREQFDWQTAVVNVALQEQALMYACGYPELSNTH